MAQEVRFALTDSKGQLTGNPKAQVESIAQGKADAVKALIPDISGLATKAEIPSTSTFATKTDLASLATKNDVSALVSKAEFDSYKETAGTGSSSVVDNGDGTATITL